jgi:hypothetical protein
MNQHHCSCTNHRTPTMGKYECIAFVRGNVAYALDALPTTHVHAITGTPWAQGTIHLCGTHHAQFINRKPININVQEDTIMSIVDTYDQDNSFDSAVAKLEGQPYTIYNGGYQGMFLLENCGHPECQQEYQEILWDNTGCICCGEDNCQHYYTLLCLNHTSKEDTMNINTIITNNEIKENNMPNSPVTGSSDRGNKWIKCVKCSKEIGSDWYHANAADVRTCMGAAPAPVKRVYKTDVLTGETVLTNSDLRFFYDSSKAVVFAKAKELREAGVHVFKVAKATKGNQDWYVEYKS